MRAAQPDARKASTVWAISGFPPSSLMFFRTTPRLPPLAGTIARRSVVITAPAVEAERGRGEARSQPNRRTGRLG